MGGADKSGPRMIVIVGGVLIAATALVLLTIGAVFGLSRLTNSSDPPAYTVGDCVVQSGDAAQLAPCTEPGAYEIVSQVDGQDECADPTQPTIAVATSPPQFYCLVPAADAAGNADNSDSPDNSGEGDDQGDGGDDAGE